MNTSGAPAKRRYVLALDVGWSDAVADGAQDPEAIAVPADILRSIGEELEAIVNAADDAGAVRLRARALADVLLTPDVLIVSENGT